jgi:nitric oxide reductase NorE protein
MPARTEKRIPGDELIWMFLIGDMICFSLFFALYVYTKQHQEAEFLAAQQALNLHTGTINTLLLLASSWFVVIAVKAARLQMASACRWFLLPAVLCGSAFCAIKIYEYQEKSAHGINFLTNDFFTFYYLITGLHLTHVLLGVPLLMYLMYSVRQGRLDHAALNNLESCAIYWHMVDLLWMVIFPLLYLVH